MGIGKLELIAALEDGWNGNGAPAFSPALIQKAETIVSGLARKPEIFPTAAGAIQLGYKGPENSHLEIAIFESGKAEVFWINRDGSEEIFSVDGDIETLNSLVESFYPG